MSIPLSPKKAFLHMSKKAVSEINLSESETRELENEIRNFHSSMKNAYIDIHKKRMEILNLYSEVKRNNDKIGNLKKQLESGIDKKEMLFIGHIEKVDSILGKNAPGYFDSIHRQLEDHFKKKP
jgi:predicted aspartyl protease